jgi:hypothetical protein
MSITLERLKTFETTNPAPGQISIAVARHDAEVWPSPEVNEYARERAEVLHRLVDEAEVPVISWGNTDNKYPSEVVELLIQILGPMAAAIAPLLMNAIASKSKGKDKPSIPGFRLTNSCGETMETTFKDSDGKADEKILAVITAFLTRSAADC